ncbi:DUF3035 domain-containing protein [Sulfitobacter sp. SK012]|uniref:DUF3035 domain-containing protein n=1 Tax=Sulfitobacter sp. SK012 TaxID=1389005 RepID=UPI000E0B444A|nr:DUF3035 domain-containing protein [Sulfitobacter sp. SK012]AXI48256.1 DUF3035 domain-containing protein [Sulfitobacter sp. SK012]
MRLMFAILLIPAFLAGCANVGLRDLRSDSEGPDEFSVQPVGALQQPSDYRALPAPTPGQANLTDRNPKQEGLTAFGGSIGNPTGPIPASNGALVQHASRLGVTPSIRQDLAVADAEFRRSKSRFTQYRIVPVDRYDQAYRSQAIDAQREAARWRQAGARTPSAPPPS